jgi:glucokinase
MILAGDVGGTKTMLALFELGASDALTSVRETTLASRELASFERAVQEFVASAPITAACFGVAGPVVDGRCVTTNLPWMLDERVLARELRAPHVRLLNDLDATAHGVLALPASALLPLQQGTSKPGNLAIIAAGTGLGEAIVARDGDRSLIVASEGGHCDFAPRTDREIDLLRYLRAEFGTVSYERVLSGPGLVSVYRLLRSGAAPEPAWLTERLASKDPAAVISQAALERRDSVCEAALDLFVSVYGAEAGNLALKVLALGGVYLAGGIAPKIRSRLTDGTFMAAFRDKGRLTELLSQVPVHVVLEPRTALVGAAHVARALS